MDIRMQALHNLPVQTLEFVDGIFILVDFVDGILILPFPDTDLLILIILFLQRKCLIYLHSFQILFIGAELLMRFLFSLLHGGLFLSV